MKFAGTTLPADGETIFLTETKKSSTSNTTYSVYEGIANVPTAKMLGDDETWYAAYKKAGDSAYTVVFLLNNDKVQMSSGNKDVIFVKGNDDGKFSDAATDAGIPITMLYTIADAVTPLQEIFGA